MKKFLLLLMLIGMPLASTVANEMSTVVNAISKDGNRNYDPSHLQNQVLRLEHILNKITLNPTFQKLIKKFEKKSNAKNYSLLNAYLTKNFLKHQKNVADLTIVVMDQTNLPLWNSSFTNKFEKYQKGRIGFISIGQSNTSIQAKKIGKGIGFYTDENGNIYDLNVSKTRGVVVTVGKADAGDPVQCYSWVDGGNMCCNEPTCGTCECWYQTTPSRCYILPEYNTAPCKSR